MNDERIPILRVLRMACDQQRWDELRRVRFTIADIMTAPPIVVSHLQKLHEVFQLFATNRIRHLLVTDDQKKLIGVLSDRDVLLSLKSEPPDPLQRQVGLLASKNLQVAKPDTSAEQAVSVMMTARISCLPVVSDKNELLGIVTSADFLWLLKILQIVNSGGPHRIVQGMTREIKHLVMENRLTETEADELTSTLLAIEADKKSPTEAEAEEIEERLVGVPIVNASKATNLGSNRTCVLKVSQPTKGCDLSGSYKRADSSALDQKL